MNLNLKHKTKTWYFLVPAVRSRRALFHEPRGRVQAASSRLEVLRHQLLHGPEQLIRSRSRRWHGHQRSQQQNVQVLQVGIQLFLGLSRLGHDRLCRILGAVDATDLFAGEILGVELHLLLAIEEIGTHLIGHSTDFSYVICQ